MREPEKLRVERERERAPREFRTLSKRKRANALYAVHSVRKVLNLIPVGPLPLFALRGVLDCARNSVAKKTLVSSNEKRPIKCTLRRRSGSIEKHRRAPTLSADQRRAREAAVGGACRRRLAAEDLKVGCRRMGETRLSDEDDRAWSGKPRTCESLELSEVQIGLETTEVLARERRPAMENSRRILTQSGCETGLGCSRTISSVRQRFPTDDAAFSSIDRDQF